MNKKVLLTLIVIVAVVGYAIARSRKNSSEAINSEVTAVTVKKTHPTASTTSEKTDINPTPVAQQPIAQKESPVTSLSDNGGEPTADDVSREDKIAETLRADKSLTKLADVSSVRCKDKKCIIEFTEKDEGNAQTPLFNFMRAHPEYGTNFTIEADPDNPKVTLFTISKENL